ncbi:MAG: zinc ribbon domain-containing protein [Chloroflexi bacterium]|nr:zinc ribbon domain-containing protein [Chloroflexota bacterium]MCI0578358.1 zinc ribbon domain-containing protein [Chloroflexota bacterium]MCI0646239.1 zinc ribbon domain-containing protein [Chloroflexota bacterium]MCI0732141.1 zinc ribbon domain-containing protein [Chloroflexota bacterium]
MTVGSILLGVALLLIVGLFVARPLLLASARRHRRPTTAQELLLHKEALLVRIHDLDFDHETGKVPAEVYQQQRARLMAEAVAILTQLDAAQQALSQAAPAVAPGESRVEAEIEAAIARRRQGAAQPPAPQPTPAVAATPATGNGRVRFCPQCGQPADPGDNFCAYCGQALRQPQPS